MILFYKFNIFVCTFFEYLNLGYLPVLHTLTKLLEDGLVRPIYAGGGRHNDHS
jgi:hypothetical protein